MSAVFIDSSVLFSIQVKYCHELLFLFQAPRKLLESGENYPHPPVSPFLLFFPFPCMPSLPFPWK